MSVGRHWSDQSVGYGTVYVTLYGNPSMYAGPERKIPVRMKVQATQPAEGDLGQVVMLDFKPTRFVLPGAPGVAGGDGSRLWMKAYETKVQLVVERS